MPTDPELQSVYEHVRHQQGRNHAESDELARSVVFEVSHRRRAMQLEENCLQSAVDGSSADVSLEHLHRYRTTSRRALLKQLSQLHRRNRQFWSRGPAQKNFNRRRRHFSDCRTEGRGARERRPVRRPNVQNQEETEN